MYIDLGIEKIYLDFNPYPNIKVFGPSKYYYVELREYTKNDSNSRLLESYEITTDQSEMWHDTFKCFIEFYCDFEFSVYKFIDGHGLKRIFTHRYSDYLQNVKFNLHSINENECNLWAQKISLYKNINQCFVSLNSNFEYLNKNFDISPKDKDIEFYKTYNIGWFPKTSTDFRSNDERMEGFVWLGNWKKFWSYQHPRLWKGLSSEQIIDDILGFS